MSNYLLIPGNERKQLHITPQSFYVLSQTRMLAQKINQKQPGTTSAAELFALGLIADIMEYVSKRYCESRAPGCLSGLLDAWQTRLTSGEQDAFYKILKTNFYGSNNSKTQKPIDGSVLLQFWANYLLAHNPATGKLSGPFFSPLLQKSAPLGKTIQTITGYLNKQPVEAFSGLTLPALFKSVEQSGSLYEQLLLMIKNWGLQHTPFETRILLGLDLYKEESKRFNAENFKSGPPPIPDYASDLYDEPEAFSTDLNWMPHLVLIAKSAYVWLDQLSKIYKQDIRRLDQIPDQELNRLANFGFTGLWLIGLWERSSASQKIKQINGNPEAVASAYALKSYEIAEDLGGWPAFQNLKERAWKRGIRLASDMVPNHMGIDSDWVVQHPDWFLSRRDVPYPTHSFNGPDLCDRPDVGIFLEDGYWHKSDAAVVFKRVDYKNNDVRYIYHGNDGTGMPWNDTAQLNYLLPQVREAVIQTILHVARNFPVIRFDAAMTLAKKHYRRLWFPQPGSGGDIPTRSEYAMSDEAFNKAFPVEFWREVVDRIQQEAPDTLLLAEAFWMMEGYFVRTLGMHRVYNSAFMNMLKNESNAEYRNMVIQVLQFNPQILKRYVNFMNNPDEETAITQFGKGDKYFGVCTLMCTMPGLPMFGHGQIEGFSERYGMEYRRAYMDEPIDKELEKRHYRQITGLLKNRPLFSEVDHFVFYDFRDGNNRLLPDVFCYSNRFNDQRALIIYHNKFAAAAGWIKQSVVFKTADGMDRQLSLCEGLSLSKNAHTYTVFKDALDGMEYIKSNKELSEKGFYAQMQAYGLHVFTDIHEVVDSPDTPWAKLYQKLAGKPQPSLTDALADLILEPVHLALKNIIDNLDAATTRGVFLNNRENIQKTERLFNSARQTIRTFEDGFETTRETAGLFLSDFIQTRIPENPAKDLQSFLAENLLDDTPFAAQNRKCILLITFIKMLFSDYATETISEYFKEWRLEQFLQKNGYDNLFIETVKVIVFHAEELWPNGFLNFARNTNEPIPEVVKSFLQINTFEGVIYFNRERWIRLLDFGLLYFILFDQKTTGTRQRKKKWNDILKYNSRLKRTAASLGYNFLKTLKKINMQGF